MSIRSYHLYRYTIPMDSQVILRNRFLKQREGLLVQIKCDQAEGWGEIAPLPEFSSETLEQAQQQTIEWLQNWDLARTQQQKLPFDGLFPSVAFGLSCAMAELKDQLTPNANYQVAPLCYGDPDQLYTKLEQLNGKKVAKIKVGLYEANRDGLIADMLLEAIPDLSLRLDANRSWSLEKALMFAKYVKPEHRHRIQFVEEPCKTMTLSRQFATETGIAIAWDESVREKNFHLISEPQLNAIIIKPTLIGSLEKCISLIQQAKTLGIEAIISSSLESSFGLSQLARIAQQYTPDTIPGLDTLDLMKVQIVRPWLNSTLPLVGLESEYIDKIL
ncbi:o-succinylbenzoate synthase [Mergibacter septicus]|uniref:o-succinylbenzoate synthase n=1 Tax=Mergibacter septicus TaxID=221402 RepID=UPI001C784116|nr:o-succinylbenzoate synthase [Mergibacter septicus]QDJ13294.1 o-succinylbenzoate synthase [Mergibacter septicus]